MAEPRFVIPALISSSVLADGVAIAVGAIAHKPLPEGFLHAMASVPLPLFGLWMLFDAALGRRGAAAATGGVAVVVPLIAVVPAMRSRCAPDRPRPVS